jgi:cytochrome c oxidase subunit 3
MSFLSPLLEKPWEQSGVAHHQTRSREYTRRSGLRLLLLVVSVLFLLFIIAFLMRSQYPDWQPLAENPTHPLFNLHTLWLNTVYLGLASLSIQWARIGKNRSSVSLKLGLLLAGSFSIAFVTGQLLLWQQLNQQGFAVNANPALSFFYLLTGLHAVHVGIGLLMWGVALTSVITGSPKFKQYVDLCAIYWHFLFGLWVVLFVLLVSKPETFDAIVTFCGLG